MNVFSDRVTRYARTCSLIDENGGYLAEMRAFISPLRYKNKMYLYGVNTEIGYNPEGYYLYIGPPFPMLENSEKCLIECGGDTYKIDRAETIRAGGDVIYNWAIIRKTVEEESDE